MLAPILPKGPFPWGLSDSADLTLALPNVSPSVPKCCTSYPIDLEIPDEVLSPTLAERAPHDPCTRRYPLTAFRYSMLLSSCFPAEWGFALVYLLGCFCGVYCGSYACRRGIHY